MTSADPQTTTHERQTGRDRLSILVFLLLVLAALLPVVLTPIPAMVDYVNHLSRMYILSQHDTADANPYYEVNWALYPNLAMDLVVPQIARLVSVENATRLFLVLSQFLIVGGALVLERVVKGRIQLAGFAALMFLYCLPFTWGFVNFQCGLGVALWGIAAYLAVVERGWPMRFIVNAVFVAGLFAAHFFSLGIYGATLGLYELWRAHDRKAPYREIVWRLTLLAIPTIVLLLFMRLTAGSIGSEGTTWFFAFKPLWLLRIMNGYNLMVSTASSSALLIALYFAAKHRFLKLEPAGVWLGIGFALLYIAIPSELVGTSFSDLRMIPAAALILPAFCALSLPNRRWTVAALAAVSAITLANLAVVYSVWLPYRADYAAMISSFQKIDRGSRLLVSSSSEDGDPPFKDLTRYPMFYAPTLAVHYADAFVPNLFTAVGKQPVRPRPIIQRLAIPYGGPMPLAVLTAIAAERPLRNVPDFIKTWSQDYDYLYVLGLHVANPRPDLLEEVDRSERFILYRIHRPAQPAATSR
jgi:hypothetical protein